MNWIFSFANKYIAFHKGLYESFKDVTTYSARAAVGFIFLGIKKNGFSKEKVAICFYVFVIALAACMFFLFSFSKRQ